MDKSDAIEELVREHAARLERHHPRIQSCRVAIERTHRHQHSANDFRVRVDLTLPGRHEVVVDRETAEGGEYHARNQREALYKLVPEAFAAAERRLEREGAERRGKVRHHRAREAGELDGRG